VAVGRPCSLSLFDPGGETQMEAGMTRSRSKNSAFLGRVLKGAVVGIVNGEKVTINE
jgi:dihydroorotase-like cyclic amidohydrolase